MSHRDLGDLPWAEQSREAMPAGSVRLIALLLGSTFVVILNETIMSVALPELMREFSRPASSVQWLTTIFLLTMAVVIPVTGWAIRGFGLHRLFVMAMTSFVIGTLLAAMAPTFHVLVLARAVQAVGTALMIPLLMTTVMRLVPVGRRGQMMGMISVVISVAPAIGPTTSGIILDQLSWRWMFWLVLPVAVLALVIGFVWVSDLEPQMRMPLDVPSVLLSVPAFGGLIYGMSELGGFESGAPPPGALAGLACGLVCLVIFVTRQVRLGDKALLDLRTFANSTFSIAVALMAMSMMVLFGALILLPIYLQNVCGLSTLATGLAMLPGGLAMGLLAPMVGSVYDRSGPRWVVIPGSVLLSGGLWLMTGLGADSAIGQVVLYHVVLSVGLSMLLTPLMAAGLGALPESSHAHGSAVISTAQQLAGGIGTALFVTVMTRVAAQHTADGQDLVTATSAGIHGALLFGAAISVAVVLMAPFLRTRNPAKPVLQPESTAAELGDRTG